jgi:hypothetical protein
MFLRFIIDNYDKLPDHVLFIHPNRYQWHNDDPDYDGLPKRKTISDFSGQGMKVIRHLTVR